MRLPMLARILDPLLENVFCLLDKLPVQINGVLSYSARGIVFTEYEFGGLFVVVLHSAAVLLAFFRELFGAGSVAVFVGLFGLPQALISSGGKGRWW
jgi:hypothetical protein